MAVVANIFAAFMEAAVKKKRTKYVCFRLRPELKQKIREIADREYRTFIQQLLYMADLGLKLFESQPSIMESFISQASQASQSRKGKSGRLLRLVSKNTAKEG